MSIQLLANNDLWLRLSNPSAEGVRSHGPSLDTTRNGGALTEGTALELDLTWAGLGLDLGWTWLGLDLGWTCN